MNTSNSKNETLLFGIHSLLEAIKSEKTIDKVFIQKGLQGDLIKEVREALKEIKVIPNEVPLEKLNRLTQKNHQGVVAYTSPVKFYELEFLVEQTLQFETKPLFLLLDQVTDVRNFGAILRTAACTGVHGIIIQNKGGAPVSADTIKTSAGAVFTIPICKVPHIKDAIYYLQASEIQIIAATEKASTLIYDTNLKAPTALLMGSEGKGISSSLLKIADQQVKLPMQGSVASLNVSVACGALLYEVVRQRLH